jgi:hypothetical protein
VGSLRRDRDELDGPADGPEIRVTIAARGSSGRRESNRTTSLEGWSPYTAPSLLVVRDTRQPPTRPQGGPGGHLLALPQHLDQHHPERPVLLAVDQPWKPRDGQTCTIAQRSRRSWGNEPHCVGEGALLVSSSKRISHARPRSCRSPISRGVNSCRTGPIRPSPAAATSANRFGIGTSVTL